MKLNNHHNKLYGAVIELFSAAGQYQIVWKKELQKELERDNEAETPNADFILSGNLLLNAVRLLALFQDFNWEEEFATEPELAKEIQAKYKAFKEANVLKQYQEALYDVDFKYHSFEDCYLKSYSKTDSKQEVKN